MSNRFGRFKSEDFDHNDKDCSGRPIELNDSVLEGLIEEDSLQSTRDSIEENLPIQLNCSSNTFLNRSKDKDTKNWFHTNYLTNCNSLSSRQERKFGGIRRELSIMSFFNPNKQLMQAFIHNK